MYQKVSNNNHNFWFQLHKIHNCTLVQGVNWSFAHITLKSRTYKIAVQLTNSITRDTQRSEKFNHFDNLKTTRLVPPRLLRSRTNYNIDLRIKRNIAFILEIEMYVMIKHKLKRFLRQQTYSVTMIIIKVFVELRMHFPNFHFPSRVGYVVKELFETCSIWIKTVSWNVTDFVIWLVIHTLEWGLRGNIEIFQKYRGWPACKHVDKYCEARARNGNQQPKSWSNCF